MRLLNYLYTDNGGLGTSYGGSGRPYVFSSISNGGVSDEPNYSKNKAIKTPGGSGNYVTCGSFSTSLMGISRTTATTVMLKIKSSDVSADRLWYGPFNESTGYGMGIFTAATTGYPYIQYKSGATNLIKCIGNTNVCNGNWNCILAAYTGSGTNAGLTVYANGALPTQTRSGTYTADPTYPTYHYMFGSTATYCPIDGIIAECAVWDFAGNLTMAQQIYNSDGDLRKLVSSQRLRAWWWCGDGQQDGVDHIIFERGAHFNSIYFNATIKGSVSIIDDTFTP